MSDDIPPRVPPSYPGDDPHQDDRAPGTPPPPPPGGYAPNWGNAYPPPQPTQQYAAYPTAPKHPQSTTALVLGIVSIAGGMACILPVLAAPFAWVIGGRAVKEIDASPGAYTGRSEANAGRIMGIVGSVLLVLLILGIILLVVLATTTDAFDESSSYDDGYYDYFLRGALGLRGMFGR